MANVGTMGSAAVAGLLGPLVDVGNQQRPGAGYVIALAAAALAALRVVRRLEGTRPGSVRS